MRFVPLSLLAASALRFAVADDASIETGVDGGMTVTVSSAGGFNVRELGMDGAPSDPLKVATIPYVDGVMETQRQAVADSMVLAGGDIDALRGVVSALADRLQATENDLADTKEELLSTKERLAEYETTLEATSTCVGWVAAHSPEHPDEAICPTAGDNAGKRCPDASFDQVVNPNAIVHGHGQQSGAIRIVGCSDGFTLDGPGTVVCNADGKWSEIPKCVATTTSITATATTTTDSNGGWKLLFRQKGCVMSRGEALETNVDNADAACYSTLRSLSDSDKVGGKFTFKYSYPEEPRQIGLLVWSQTSNPVEETQSVSGYTPINVGWATSDEGWTCETGASALGWEDAADGRGGLSRSSNPNALLDGEGHSKNWHIALGSNFIRDSTLWIPGPCGAATKYTWSELYICTREECE